MGGLNGQFNARLQRLERGGSNIPSPNKSDVGKNVVVNKDGEYQLVANGLINVELPYYESIYENIDIFDDQIVIGFPKKFSYAVTGQSGDDAFVKEFIERCEYAIDHNLLACTYGVPMQVVEAYFDETGNESFANVVVVLPYVTTPDKVISVTAESIFHYNDESSTYDNDVTLIITGLAEL